MKDVCTIAVWEYLAEEIKLVCECIEDPVDYTTDKWMQVNLEEENYSKAEDKYKEALLDEEGICLKRSLFVVWLDLFQDVINNVIETHIDPEKLKDYLNENVYFNIAGELLDLMADERIEYWSLDRNVIDKELAKLMTNLFSVLHPSVCLLKIECLVKIEEVEDDFNINKNTVAPYPDFQSLMEKMKGETQKKKKGSRNFAFNYY